MGEVEHTEDHICCCGEYESRHTIESGHSFVDAHEHEESQIRQPVARQVRPRRRVVLVAKIEADDWNEVSNTLQHLRTQIAMHGGLPERYISGGYSSGHIIVSSEDASISHDSWSVDLDEYLQRLKSEEATRPNTQTEQERP